MPDNIKINLDYSSPYNKNIVDVSYDFLEVNLEFEDSLKITINMNQFDELYKKMIELHNELYGIEEGAV